MSDQIRVMDDAALREARHALIEYAEKVQATLGSVDSEVERVGRRLTDEFPKLWHAKVREGEGEVAKAKTAIMRKRIISAPEPASVVDETKALRRADAKLDFCRGKEEASRRWAIQWSREAPLYKTSIRMLQEQVHRSIPEAVRRLDEMMRAIEEYQKVQPPRVDGSPGPGEAGGPA